MTFSLISCMILLTNILEEEIMSRRVGVRSENKEQAILEIEQALEATTDIRSRERLQSILMLLHSEKYDTVAKYTGRSKASIHNYASAYREHGIEGLAMNYSPGRTSRLTPKQIDNLKDIIENKTPEEMGFKSEMNWISPLIQKLIEKEYGVKYTNRGVRALLKRIDFSFTRPNYTLEKADPEKQEVFKQDFEDLKKN